MRVTQTPLGSHYYLFSAHGDGRGCPAACHGFEEGHKRILISAHGGQKMQFWHNAVDGFVVPEGFTIYFYTEEGQAQNFFKDGAGLWEADYVKGGINYSLAAGGKNVVMKVHEIYKAGQKCSDYELSKIEKPSDIQKVAKNPKDYASRTRVGYAELKTYVTQKLAGEFLDICTVRNRASFSTPSLSEIVKELSKLRKPGQKIALHCSFCRSGGGVAYDATSFLAAQQAAVEYNRIIEERTSIYMQSRQQACQPPRRSGYDWYLEQSAKAAAGDSSAARPQAVPADDDPVVEAWHRGLLAAHQQLRQRVMAEDDPVYRQPGF